MDFSWLDPNREWRGLKSVGRVVSVRTLLDSTMGEEKTTREVRHFLCSIAGDVEESARHTRDHWGIENSQHWVLGVAFREDECRVRVGHAAENLALLRKIALNMLKGEKTLKAGVEAKRLRCGWGPHYLEAVLAQKCFQTERLTSCVCPKLEYHWVRPLDWRQVYSDPYLPKVFTSGFGQLRPSARRKELAPGMPDSP